MATIIVKLSQIDNIDFNNFENLMITAMNYDIGENIKQHSLQNETLNIEVIINEYSRYISILAYMKETIDNMYDMNISEITLTEEEFNTLCYLKELNERTMM